MLWSVSIVLFRLHYVVILFYFLFASFSSGQYVASSMPFLATCHACELLYCVIFLLLFEWRIKFLSLSLLSDSDLWHVYPKRLYGESAVMYQTVYQILAKSNNIRLNYSELKIEIRTDFHRKLQSVCGLCRPILHPRSKFHRNWFRLSYSDF